MRPGRSLWCRFGAALASTAEDGPLDGFGCRFLHTVEDVGIGEGRLSLRMPSPRLHDLHRHAGIKAQGDEGMPKVVQHDRPQAGGDYVIVVKRFRS